MTHILLRCGIFILVCNVLAIAFMFGVRAMLRPEKDTNDVIGYYFSIIGTIYGVLLSFILVQAWNGFAAAESYVELEASSLGQVMRLSQGLPQTSRASLRQAVGQYAEAMVNEEWPAMQRGETSTSGTRFAAGIWRAVSAVRPVTNSEGAYLGKTLDSMNDFSNARRMRQLKSRQSLPNIMWLVLWAGAAITIGFSCIFGVQRTHMHVLKLVGLTTMIALVLYAIWEIDGAFSGDVVVSSRAFSVLSTEVRGDYFLLDAK